MALTYRLFAVFQGAATLLAGRGSDSQEPEARALERRRRVILSAMTSGLSRVLSIATVLISVPLTLHYLGAERYGMWLTISSLIAMLSFADLGMGNGLLNSIARAHGEGDTAAIQRYVSSGFLIFSCIAGCIILAFGAAYPFVNWPEIFNAQDSLARREAGPALATFIIIFAINVPLGVVSRAQTGLQESFKANAWQCAGSIMGLLGMIAVIHAEAGLPWLVAAAFGAQALASLLNSVRYFGRTRPDLRVQWSSVSSHAIRQIASTGLLFFVLQVVVAVAYASDNVVIARILGASAVTTYAVPEKLFSFVAIAVTTVLTPLWPAYGEALTKGDIPWVRRTFTRSLTLAVGTAAGLSIAIAWGAQTLLSFWVGRSIDPPMLLLVGLATWKTIEAGGNAMAMLLNGANVVRIQVITAVLTGISALTLKIVLVPIFGVAGTVWASIISFSVVSIVPLTIWALPQALSNGTGRIANAHA